MNFEIKILVVDDFATMRRIVKGSLKQFGFNNFLEAENGKEALSILKTEKVGLILSDWNMPDMNGLELLKAVRADPGLKGIPLIMVTAEGQKDNILDAVKSGVSDYIMKPFTPDKLRAKIEKVLG